MLLTPEKGSPGRDITIRERSLSFCSHAQFTQFPHRGYDPNSLDPGDVTLYHGCRRSSWPKFCYHGISPRQGVPNELCPTGAFYMSNSPRHAFEHPLQQHPHRRAGDTVSLIVFTIPIPILHGERAAPGQEEPFLIQWFEDADTTWQEFCTSNLYDPHSKQNDQPDPACIPRPNGRVSALQDESDQLYIQIAFCSPRSWRWIESCASALFTETRNH